MVDFERNRQAPIGDDNYLHLAARAGFDAQLTKRTFENEVGLHSRLTIENEQQHYFEGMNRRIEDRRFDDSMRKCLDSDSINRRYDKDNSNNSMMRRCYDNNSETVRNLQKDLMKFDNGLNSSPITRTPERNGNENLDNNRRLIDNTSILTAEGISLSGSLSRKLSNYENTRKIEDSSLNRRLRDDASDISSSSISARGNHLSHN